MKTIEIKKPIYGTYVAIRDKYLKEAQRYRKMLTIATWVNGKRIKARVSPSEWKKTGKRIRRVFLIPNHPMTLWANHLSRFIKKEKPIVSPLNSLYDMPLKYRNRIRQMLHSQNHLTKGV